MNGCKHLHSILVHIGRHSIAHQCICGGNAHEQKADFGCCCSLRRSPCLSSNVWRLRRSGGANRQSRYRERFSFDGSLQVLSPSPSSSLLVAPRLSSLPLVVRTRCKSEGRAAAWWQLRLFFRVKKSKSDRSPLPATEHTF